MQKRLKKRIEEFEVPTASLVDIAFLIIIFFIMTTTLAVTRGIRADMPSAQKEQSTPNNEKTPIVNLNGPNLTLNDQSVTLEQLGKQLLEQRFDLKTDDGKVVMFEASGEVDYQRYFEVIATISSTGGVIAFVTE